MTFDINYMAKLVWHWYFGD